MKKFFSLVLALVMALSLTTVAWGAATTLPAAVNGVITLTEDVTVADGFTITEDTVLNLNGHTMTATGERAYLLTVTGDADLTIYGGKLVAESTNHMLNGTGTSTGASSSVYFNSTGRLTMTDVEVQGSVRGGHRAIEVLDGSAVLTNVDITSYYGSGVNASGNAYVVLDNCDITVNGMYSAPYNSVCFSVMYGGEIVINSGNYKLINDATYATGDTHGGWVGIVMNSGGTITINGGTFTNVPAAGFNPSYERAIIEAENLDPATATVNLYGGTFIPQSDNVVSGYGDVSYPVINGTLTDNSNGKWTATEVPSVAKVGIREYKTVADAVAAAGANDTIVLLDASATIPSGYEKVLTTGGTYVVVPSVTSGDKFDLYVADSGMKVALAAGAEDVAGLSFTQVAAVANSDGSGNLAYIAASNGEYFVKTTNPTVADYAVTVAGKTDVLYYVSVVDAADMAYGATATAFTNFGKSCGQLYQVDTTKVYYVIEKADATFALAKDDVTYAVDPTKAASVNVLVGGEIKTVAPVAVDDTNKTLTIDEILAHNWAVTGVQALPTGVTYPTEVKCLNCGAAVTTLYKSSALVPAGNKFVSVPGYEQAGWVFVEPAATGYTGGAVVTPSTDKVQSAATFDAGIAMYVGMSVLAATGSAVVIGKKKD